MNARPLTILATAPQAAFAVVVDATILFVESVARLTADVTADALFN